MKQLVVILIAVSITTSAWTQENPVKKKGKLGIGMGLNFLGPSPQMAKLMVKYDFDDYSYSWLSGKTYENPRYYKVGVSWQISYSYSIDSRSQVGMLYNYSNLGTVDGYSRNGGSLYIKLTNFSMVPLYTFELNRYWDLQTGLALMINLAHNNKLGDEDQEKYAKVSPGLLTGLNLKIWDGENTFGRIDTQYLLTTQNKIGPFTGTDNSTVTIPESKIRFSHLNILFAFGANL